MKRRLTKLVVFLLLGAIVNVAVAWGCAAWRDQMFVWRHDNVSSPSNWPGKVESSWPQQACTRVTSVSIGSVRHISMGIHRRVLDQYAGWQMVPQAHMYYLTVERVGFPLHSLSAMSPVAPGDITYGRVAWKWALWIPLDAELLLGARGERLPQRPLWFGFTINTIFYATILWLLTLAPFTARRMIRRKRSHCIKCGYDLRGTEHEACPECGVETTAKVVE